MAHPRRSYQQLLARAHEGGCRVIATSNPTRYMVTSAAHPQLRYKVLFDPATPAYGCGCRDFYHHRVGCKHLAAVHAHVQANTRAASAA